MFKYFSFTQGDSQKYANCKTTGGPAGVGVPCKIPFIWRQNPDFPYQKYWGCVDDIENPGKTWCSTEVDTDGRHVTGKGAYGFCSNSCPKHPIGPEPGPQNGQTSDDKKNIQITKFHVNTDIQMR